MKRTLKVLSALLSYPTAELQAAVPELRVALDAEGRLPQRNCDRLDRLLEEIATRDLYDLQERYVLLFDRTRSLSLNLFEHVHGESRDRGQAMVDLRALYERHGLEISATELPDYLPLFLEFLALRPRAEALELLAQPRDVIAALAERLRRRASAYAPVLQALAELAGARHDAAPVAELLQQPEAEPDDLEALDAAWEAEAVRFGPGAAGGAQPGGCAPASGVVARVPFPKVSSARSTSNG
jgi:nitrate reductase delta subunit